MKKVVTIAIITILSGALWYYNIEINTKKTNLLENNPELLAKFSSELGYIWRNAEVSNARTCKIHLNVDDSYYRCNPYFMECLLKNKLIKLNFKNNYYNLSIQADLETFKVINKTNHREFSYNILVNDKNKLQVRFKDSCSEVYLPQRFYPYLLNNRQNTLEWDNFKKKIFIDKYQVRNWEIYEWGKLKNIKKIKKEYKRKVPYKVALGLLPLEMKKYCEAQGKKNLSARVFDAASIHPENLSNSKSKLFRAPYYPWARKNSSTLIFKIQKNDEINLDENKIIELCKQVYSKDCLKYSYSDYSTWNSSWMGAYDIFGGHLEYVINEVDPTSNIILSSYYFPWKSKVHRTGMRGFWDGEALSLGSFDFKGFEPHIKDSLLNVAFRCMRQI